MQYIISGSLLVGLIGYFAKREHAQVKNDIEKLQEDKEAAHDRIVKLESRLETIEKKIPSEFENMEKIFGLKLDEIKNVVRHLEQTILAQSETFIKLLEQYKKEK